MNLTSKTHKSHGYHYQNLDKNNLKQKYKIPLKRLETFTSKKDVKLLIGSQQFSGDLAGKMMVEMLIWSGYRGRG